MHEATGLVFTKSGKIPPAPLVRSYAMIFLQIFSLIQTIPKFQTPIAEIPAFSNCYVVLAHDDVKGSLLRANIFGEH